MVWFPTRGGGVRPRHIALIVLVLGLIVVAFLGTRLHGEGDARLDAQHRAEVAAAAAGTHESPQSLPFIGRKRLNVAFQIVVEATRGEESALESAYRFAPILLRDRI